jgi:RimJ/RimL family protein N-acetyltransferase
MPAFEPISLTVSDELTLSPFTIEDAPALVRAVDDPEIRRWLPLPDPYTPAIAASWCGAVTRDLRETGRGLVLAARQGDQLAGCIDAKRVDWRARTAELGYWTTAAHRGRGVMTAAVGRFSDWLLDELGFERIELRIATENTGSRRVAEKAGFEFEGVARNAGFTDSGRVDLAIHSRIRSRALPGPAGAR